MTGTRSSAAFYADSLDAFLCASDNEVYAPLASPHGSRDDAAHAVFLSGNGPLVAALREALAREQHELEIVLFRPSQHRVMVA